MTFTRTQDGVATTYSSSGYKFHRFADGLGCPVWFPLDDKRKMISVYWQRGSHASGVMTFNTLHAALRMMSSFAPSVHARLTHGYYG